MRIFQRALFRHPARDLADQFVLRTAKDQIHRFIQIVQVLFGGNAIAAHDVESALLGTSLGVALHNGQPIEGGHRHHMIAINTIRRAGSLRAAVEQGISREGVMYECVRNNVAMVLAGSVRDDGPLPDVVTDMIEAQRQMRAALHGPCRPSREIANRMRVIA